MTKSSAGNKKTISVQRTIKENIIQYIEYVIIVLTTVLIFYPPYMQGLFFVENQNAAIILVYIIFIIYCVNKYLKNELLEFKSLIDYVPVIFLFVYTLSLISAVQIDLAIHEWFKYLMYLCLYIVITDMMNNSLAKKVFVTAILLSGLGVAVLGLDAAANGEIAQHFNRLFRIFGAEGDIFYGLFESNRIFSTLQYPNTLAIYMVALYFISLGVISSSKRKVIKYLQSSACIVYITVMILTLSRGVFLLVPFLLLLYLIFVPSENRLKSVLYAFSTIISGIIISTRLYLSIQQSNIELYWIIILIAMGSALSILIMWLSDEFIHILQRIKYRFWIILISVITLVCIAGLVIILNTHSVLEIGHTEDEKNSWKNREYSVSLEPGDYTLEYESRAYNNSDSSYVYQIIISSKSEKQLITNGSTQLTRFIQNDTKENFTKNSVSFSVPDDTEVVKIRLQNYYNGTKAYFKYADIIDEITDKRVKGLNLNYRFIPEFIQNRMEGLSTSKSNVQRMVYYKDGLNVLKENWFFGAGGSAWSLLYHKHQSFDYISSQAHNYYLQIAIESGLFGIIAIIFMIAAFIYTMLSRMKEKRSIENTALFTACIALLIHAAIDFNFSLVAIYMLFWQLSAMYSQSLSYKIDTKKRKYYYALKPLLPAVMIILLIIYPIRLAIASSNYDKALDAAGSGSIQTATKYINRAVNNDPLNPYYKLSYANILSADKSNLRDNLIYADNAVKRAIDIAWYDAYLLGKIANYSLKRGHISEAVELTERATMLRPLKIDFWYHYSYTLQNAAVYLFEQKKQDEAYEYIEKSLEIVESVKEINKSNLKPFVFNDDTMNRLEESKYLYDNRKKQIVVLITGIAFALYPDMDINNDGIPDQWEYDTSLIKTYYEDDTFFVERTENDDNAVLKSRKISFEKGFEYIIEMTLDEDYKEKTFPFKIDGIANNALMVNEHGTYRFKLSVNSNIDDARLIIPVKNNISIKELVIRVNINISQE